MLFMSIGTKELRMDKITPRGKLLAVFACQIAAIRTNACSRLTPRCITKRFAAVFRSPRMS